ncbi:hypothetical protein, partial [Ralstonia pseudosolanacearum]
GRDSHRGAGSFCPLRRRIDLRKPTTSSKPRVAKVGVTIDFLLLADRPVGHPDGRDAPRAPDRAAAQ